MWRTCMKFLAKYALPLLVIFGFSWLGWVAVPKWTISQINSLENSSHLNTYAIETHFWDADGMKTPINVAFIFTRAANNSSLQFHFKRCITSILSHSSVYLQIFIITDQAGYIIASQILKQAYDNFGIINPSKIYYISAEDFMKEIKEPVLVLQEFFTNRKNSYYRDLLFFFSLLLYNVLPRVSRVILLDIDTRVTGDIANLYSYFSNFKETEIIGMSHELSPVYFHILQEYRKVYNSSAFGLPSHVGGFPGFNSGIMLIDILKLKNSVIINSYLQRSKLLERTLHYKFQGHLGDQDLYTLIAFDHPEIFYTLPCTWNRQLCQWWNSSLYYKIFDDYFRCDGKVYIIHGNCKSKIPEDEL